MSSLAKIAFVFGGSALVLLRAAGQSNTPPVFLETPTNQTVVEFSALTVTNTATDADIPTNKLTYALLGAPQGASIDTNGVIHWTPNEAQGPGTNTITTVVADDGVPPLTALNSFTVVVLETNRPPLLGFVNNRTIAALSTLRVTNQFVDGDLPTNTLSWALLDPPAGAMIFSEVIEWTPSVSFIGTTNTFRTVLTDNGVPPLSVTNSFVVTVIETNGLRFHTNALLSVNFAVTAYVQTYLPTINTNLIPAASVLKFSTAGIVETIGRNRGLGTNIFGKNAKLFLKLPDLKPENAYFVVRSGNVESNVSANIQLYSPVTASVTSIKHQSGSGMTNLVDYTVLEFDMYGTRGSFNIQGLGTIRSTSVTDRGKLVSSEPVISGFAIGVSGPGRVDGAVSFFRGTVTAAGRKIEVVQSLDQ